MTELLRQLAIGFWKNPRLDGEASSFIRASEVRGRTFLVSANAARSGFERAAPDLSSAMLDAAIDTLTSESKKASSVHDLLDQSFGAAATVLSASTPEYEEQPVGWMFAACIADRAVEVRWAGGDELLLTCGGELIAQTLGHTASNQGQPHAPDFLVRGIGAEYGSGEAEVLVPPWKLRGDERLVLLSRSIVRSLQPGEIIKFASCKDAETAADGLVAAVARQATEAFAAAVVCECR